MNNNKLPNLYIISLDDIICLEEKYYNLDLIGGLYYIIETSVKLITDYSPVDEELFLDDFYDIYTGFGKQKVTFGECIKEYQEIFKKIKNKLVTNFNSGLHNYTIHHWLDQTTLVLEEKESLELLTYDKSFDKSIMFDEDDYRNKEYTSTYVY